MSNTMYRFVRVCVFASVFAVCLIGSRVTAAVVGPAGHTNAFGIQPVAADWVTLSIAGAGGDNYDQDIDVNTNANINVATLTAAPTLNAASPPAQLATATWSSTGLYLQTRPTGNRYTVLMGKFMNGTGTNATEIRLSYQLSFAGNVSPEDAGKGTHVYYSLSGLANSWAPLPSLNTTATSGTSEVATNLAVNWTNGAPLYLLWSDDNNNGGTDVGHQIDNFSLQVTAGLPPYFLSTLTSPQSNATILSGTPITATAAVGNGIAPFTVRFFTNSGAGNLDFNEAGAANAAPYEWALGVLPPGTYNIFASATDSDSPPSTVFTATNTFVVAAPISISLDSPPDGATFDNSTSVSATASVSGGTGPYSVQFYVDNVPSGSPLVAAPYSADLGALFVGDHTIHASVTDARGWISNSAPATIRITGPLGASLSPTNEAVFIFGENVQFDALVGGGTPPYVALLYINGEVAAILNPPSFSTSFGAIPSGSYTAYVHVTDSSVPAQQQYSATNVFTVLPNPILVALVSPTNGQSVNASVAMNLSATAAVGAPLSINRVEFFVDGTSAGADTNPPYSTAFVPTEGSHIVYAAATDSLGRVSYSPTNTFNATAAPGANNNFANAFILSGPVVTSTGNNSTANREQGEPFPANNFGGATLWWAWTPSASGPTTIDTMGSDFNTVLGVYTGNAVNALTLVAANNDYDGNTWSRVDFNAIAGTTYRIVVDGFSSGFGNPARGNVVLNIRGVGGLNILTPTNGTIVTVGDPIPLLASIDSNFPNPPATRVDFYRNGALVATSSTEPFSAVITNAPPGSNTFVAVGYNSLGAPVQSAAVNVFVQRIGVTLLSPVEDAVFLNTNPITVAAWTYLPEGAISSVDFYVNGAKFGEDNTAPFSAVWSNVVSGSHRLTAVGRTASGETYISQPVNIGVAAVLMPFSSVWKYLDDGSNQGTNWIAPDFEDSSWKSGLAPLGYSDSNGRLPATTNSFGPDANNKFVTTYYRTAVSVDNPAAFSAISLNIERDDGAIVYLNGVEVGRFNMPTGLVTSTTFATGNAADDGGTVFSIQLPPTRFIAGQNVLAVEIHQDSANSSDIWFQMQLVGIPFIVHNVSPQVAITSPGNESIHVSPENISVSASASDPDGSVTRVEFLLDGLPLGQRTTAPYTVDWLAPVVGPHVLTAIASDDLGGVTESAPVNVYIFDAIGSPIAQITSPTNNTIVEGPTNITISAFAAALDSVTQVEFFANHTLIGTSATAPFGISWDAPFGVNELLAVAVGADGKRGTSAPVTITVTIPPTNTVAPIIFTQLPLAFADVTNAVFTNITVVFSERVQNVDAGDLLVNGVPAVSVTGSGSNYVFSFPQPPYGEVEIAFAHGHGITDFGYPSVLPFDELDASAAWEYEYLDVIPPTIVARSPLPGAFVTNLITVAVTFSEAVTGVDATDLLINGTPAFNVTGEGSNYIFDVIQPASGTVNMSWSVNHGIVDRGVTGPPNPFNRTGPGATWSFTLDTRTVLVQSNATWMLLKGLTEASNPTNAWRQLAFDASTWTNSPAPFVFGEPGFTNALNPGTDLGDMANNAYSGIYLRKTFVVPNVSAITNLLLNHLADDGFIAWINGVEVLRYNAPPGEVPFNGGASGTATETGGNSGVPWIVANLTNGPAALVTGTNILAVHAFNVITTPASSDFAFNAQLYTFLSDAAFAPPRIISLAPAQGDVFHLTNLVVTFSESVDNVDASDLLVNGVPATSVSAGQTNTVFNFVFAQPAYGPVTVTWDSAHGIVDRDTPPKPFGTATFHYILVNPSAPIVIAQAPAASMTITGLTSITITFSEPVGGVDASDLLVNAIPANSVTGTGDTYTFSVTQPPYGVVAIHFAADNGIRDLDDPANLFDRDRPANQWTYALVDPVPRVTMVSPTNGAFVLAPADIPLRVNATDNDGTIVLVQYFHGTTLIAEAAEAPFSVTWSNVPVSTYTLHAIATDNSGFKATSAPVTINVVSELPAFLTRGPYLQMGSPTGGVVRWRTDLAVDSVVRYGLAPDALNNVVTVPELTTEHIVSIAGLQPQTKYYYSFGSTSRVLGGGTNADGSNYWFITSPVAGTRKPTRLWILGDSGTANANARAVRDAYYNYAATNGRAADIWLMLGDNAYNSGTDAEHQAAVFNMYPDTLRNLFLWPTIGNHETAQSTTATAFPYLDIFTLPQNGEAGGTPSGTEKYYSFDYANIHFVCLDSMTSGRTSTSTMAQWLRDDLANSMQEWNIVFFHHPPYTKGSHNSDVESDLIQIRQNLVPILEEYGVDLVLSGHSHSYERSYLIHGQYGLSTTFAATNKVDGGDGREDGTGAYRKNGDNVGVVYTVAGSSGQISGGQLNHPAHFVSLNDLGSMIIDVSSNRLDAIFLTGSGAVNDHFTLRKRASVPAPADLIARAIGLDQIELTWNDNGGNELGFVIERSLDGTNFVRLATNAPNVTVFIDRMLLANTAYFYRVLAIDVDGEASVSTVADGFTGNRPPVLAAIADRIVDVARLMALTNSAADPEPGSVLTYSLGADAPAGVRLRATNGVLYWRPERSQAATTNVITVLVTDDGTPAMTATQSFTVVVRDYVELGIGSAVMRAGDGAQVSINFAATTGITNLTGIVQLNRQRLTDIALVNLAPALASMSLDLTMSDAIGYSFGALPGQVLAGTQELARIQFTAAPDQISAFVPLQMAGAQAWRSEAGLAPTILLNSGRATVIGTQPLVEANVDGLTAARRVTLYGIPGVAYTIDKSFLPETPGSWQPWQPVTLSGLSQTIEDNAPIEAPSVFYRARE